MTTSAVARLRAVTKAFHSSATHNLLPVLPAKTMRRCESSGGGRYASTSSLRARICHKNALSWQKTHLLATAGTGTFGSVGGARSGVSPFYEEVRMIRRSLTVAVLTVLTVALAACASPTAPSAACGVGVGSGTCS